LTPSTGASASINKNSKAVILQTPAVFVINFVDCLIAFDLARHVDFGAAVFSHAGNICIDDWRKW
jgi:hypothetical protein